VVTSRLNTAEAIAGLGVELEAIAAVIMGGTSFFGGEGSIGGTLLGALIIAVLGNGLTILNVPSYYQQLVIGLVFILAVVADKLRRKGRSYL
jgi:ribose/xylose/arabinose/galactoside ABC-type transport system permease subunit